MSEIVYFELNNWKVGEDYPAAEPFLTWMRNDFKQYFGHDQWAKYNELVVVRSTIDLSSNYCIAAKKEWVEKHCPELLTEYREFLREPEEEDYDDLPTGRFGGPFMEYKEENFGVHWAREEEGPFGYDYWVLED